MSLYKKKVCRLVADKLIRDSSQVYYIYKSIMS